MEVKKDENNININMNAIVTQKEFSSGKEGWYERADVIINGKIYTAQVQIYEKKK